MAETQSLWPLSWQFYWSKLSHCTRQSCSHTYSNDGKFWNEKRRLFKFMFAMTWLYVLCCQLICASHSPNSRQNQTMDNRTRFGPNKLLISSTTTDEDWYRTGIAIKVSNQWSVGSSRSCGNLNPQSGTRFPLNLKYCPVVKPLIFSRLLIIVVRWKIIMHIRSFL